MTPTILLLGFAPFGPYTQNPTQQLAEALADHAPWLRTSVLPVDRHKAAKLADQATSTHKPHAVLAMGLGSGPVIRMERVAVNIADFRIPDTTGQQPIDQPIVADGPAAHFSTLPMRAMMEKLNQHGIPSILSETAGTYLCNLLLYHLLHHADAHQTPYLAGFVHVPLLPEMVAQRLQQPFSTGPIPPSMSLSVMQKGIILALDTIHTTLQDTL